MSCANIYSRELRRPRCNARIFNISLKLLMGPCLAITTVGAKVKYHRLAATDYRSGGYCRLNPQTEPDEDRRVRNW